MCLSPSPFASRRACSSVRLAAGVNRNRPLREPRPLADLGHDPLASGLVRRPRLRDRSRPGAVTAEEGEEQVLGADEPVSERPGLLLRVDHDRACLSGEARERVTDAAARSLHRRPASFRPSTGCDRVDDLVDALVGEAEPVSDLAHRPAAGVKPPHRVAEVRLGALRLVLKLEQPVARRPCLNEDLFVECHAVYGTRQLANCLAT